jgi:septal ring factor EnvC (AmiA/AmiB activator)
MTDLLGALARLDRNPPPALAVKPDDALGAMRGAILLGDAVPELHAEAQALKRRLDELQALRASIMAEREVLARATASLERDRADLENRLNDKLARQKKLAADASSEEERAEKLSRQATDLTDLIARLEDQAQSRLPQSRPAPQSPAPRPVAAPGGRDAPEPGNAGESPAKPAELALLSPPSEPAALPSSRHFSEAKGLIRLPATGLLVSGFGDRDGAGGHTEGMTIATRPGAQVVAPFDGKIVYAGPFRRYGQLLILSVGEGYHVLLSGMAEIDGQVGQTVLAGEPVGRMAGAEEGDNQPSSNENARSRQKTATDGRPSLYIEFRKDSDPIDPRPWLKMSDKKARG